MSFLDSDIENVDKGVKEEVETCVDDDDVQADQDAPRIFGGTETPMTQEVPRMFGGTETPMTQDAPRMFGGTETPMTGYGEGDGGPRVYCTEDTPGVFSRADSLSSLDSCEETSAAARQQVCDLTHFQFDFSIIGGGSIIESARVRRRSFLFSRSL